MKLDYSKSWILQKVTAIIFLLFLIYLFFSLQSINIKNHNELLIWFSNFFNFFSFTLLFSAVVIHSKLVFLTYFLRHQQTMKIKKRILLMESLKI